MIASKRYPTTSNTVSIWLFTGYVREEFLAFMHAVDKALAMELSDPGETPDRVSVQLQRFPYPPYTMDYFSEEIKSQLPLLIILGFLFTVPDLSSSIKLEKEKRLKVSKSYAGLLITGLHDNANNPPQPMISHISSPCPLFKLPSLPIYI